MTDTEILTKTISKAVKNGWDKWGWKTFQVVMGGVGFYDGKGDFIQNKGELYSDFDIIFSHSFAKAFFGEEEIEVKPDWAIDASYRMGAEANHETLTSMVREIRIAWQFHLQQMVLEKNPIKYLGRFL